jgi:LEA14-like dessication related protein
MLGSLRKLFFLGTAIVLFSSLGACAVLPPPNLKAPALQLAELELIDIGLSRMRFGLKIDATNPNDSDIPLSNIKFDFSLFGVILGSGTTREPNVFLPRATTTRIPLEFAVGTTQLIDLIRRTNYREFGKLSYELKGSAQWGNGPITMPFEKRADLQSIQRLTDWIRLR